VGQIVLAGSRHDCGVHRFQSHKALRLWWVLEGNVAPGADPDAVVRQAKERKAEADIYQHRRSNMHRQHDALAGPIWPRLRVCRCLAVHRRRDDDHREWDVQIGRRHANKVRSTTLCDIRAQHHTVGPPVYRRVFSRVHQLCMFVQNVGTDGVRRDPFHPQLNLVVCATRGYGERVPYPRCARCSQRLIAGQARVSLAVAGSRPGKNGVVAAG
jgi:hypothetical protein